MRHDILKQQKQGNVVLSEAKLSCFGVGYNIKQKVWQKDRSI